MPFHTAKSVRIEVDRKQGRQENLLKTILGGLNVPVTFSADSPGVTDAVEFLRLSYMGVLRHVFVLSA